MVAATQDHGRRLHNMLPTRGQVLATVVPSETRAAVEAGDTSSDERAADMR
jgi:hypothetical protein